MDEGSKSRSLRGVLGGLFGPAGDKAPVPGKNWTVLNPNIEMVWIVPGSFMMGSPVTEFGRDEGENFHHVTLTKGFWLGKYPITQWQWEAVAGYNPSAFGKAGGDAPVENVTWEEAMKFCRTIAKSERESGRLTDVCEYGLPTEAQWEYACRAGTIGPYAGTGVLDQMGWFYDNSGTGRESPVGMKKPNAWGLYDMHGNVCEWCSDVYGDYPESAVIDPTGPKEGAVRVHRGGSNCSIARYCRSAIRLSDGQSNRQDDLGFRIALRIV